MLLVDDETVIRRVIGDGLSQYGYDVTVAEHGRAALEHLASGSFDVVLLDRSMPGAPGATLLPLVRERAPNATVLYFTGQDVDPAERALVDGIIHKPIRLAALAEAIAAAIAKRHER